MSTTANLGLVKPTHGINVVEGETATGQPNEAANLDAIDLALSGLGGAASASGVSVADYPASGAITQKAGVVTLSAASAEAMTLAAPTAGADDGKHLAIVSKTAFAHTVVGAVGYSGGTNKTATFGAAAGNMLLLIALGGVWYQLPSTGITLSA
ncbi:MAG: hypothetical protein LAN84_00255 [Acidobacteriia bacterium]|nr:hypothetical protein [Terriglobia bacterium]